ncbi:MAG TPA: sensor histidine kinase [Oceanospirillaceae bacterium]|jgi:two-component system C4-dicarboxylate transport sensor histidine kinase DctB|nr:sensor histidine kinase [Oceanospirillaceae bacterium]
MSDKNDIQYKERSWLQNNVKTIYMAALLITLPSWGWMSWITLTQTSEQQLQQQVYSDIQLFADSLNSELEKYRFVPKMLMLDAGLVERTTRATSDHSGILANPYLQHIRQATNADEIFIVDPQGTTIASTKTSNIGIGYRHSPFFIAAKAGNSGGFFTLGLHAGIRGYYFSEPLFDPTTDEVAGVIVVKVNMARLERGWLNKATPMLITDNYGVIIASSTPSWLFTSLSPLSAENKQQIRHSRKYPMVSFPLLQTTTHKQIEGGQVVSLPRAGFKKVLEVNKFMPNLGWTIYGHGNLAAAKQSVQQGVAISSLLWVLLLSLAYVVTQRRLQFLETLHRREVNQARLQQAKDQLETRVAERTHELQESNLELKQTQQELIHSAKLATLGQLATSVTHEINQPLTAILTSADNAEQWLGRGQVDKARDKLAQIKTLAQKMGLITSHLKTFGRKTDDKNDWICPQVALDNAFALLQPRINQEQVETVIEDLSSFQVLANDVRLEQVFINLISNALDAMQLSQYRRLTVYCQTNATAVEIHFSDTGSGIDNDHLLQLFDPFFSTKDVGVGLGLGLTISYSIIKTMGGDLSARNSATGAVFSIRLRAASKSDRNL